MRKLRSLSAGLAAAVLASAGPVLADAAHARDASAGVQARAERDRTPGFATPEPGSYSLPPLGAAGDGEVLNSDGSPTTLHASFGDGAVLLSFIYASCSDAEGCPLATAVLHRVKHRLGNEPELAGRLRILSLSFDPTRDTPEVMERYGASIAAGDADWRFLTTASQAELRPILEAYGQTVVRSDEGGDISHVLRVFLIDSQRRIRNIYSASYLYVDALISDAKTLLLESRRAAAAGAPAAASRRGPGDDRAGYERPDYRTRSLGIAARRGEPTDLLGRARAGRLGLPPLPVPADNPLTREKVALGRKLFYDRRLSLNGTVSCAMCHIPEQGFASNELATAVGIEGRTVRRNAPTIYNVAYLSRLFHDGRETRLEHQVWAPLLASNEMGNPSIGAVIEKIRAADDYDGLFEAAFPDRGLSMQSVGQALGSYERTLISGGSPFDRWHYAGDEAAVGSDVKRGFEIFRGKARCSACHTLGPETALFSDGRFHNTGVGYKASMGRAAESQRLQVAPGRYLTVDRDVVAQVARPAPTDLGRYEITQNPRDRWKYRTPSLRNVALTAPYMHDGSLATLRDVVAFYDQGGVPNEELDPLIAPLGLSEAERNDLVAFLASLTGDDVDALVADAFAAPIGDVR